jgi:hypothetical protein
LIRAMTATWLNASIVSQSSRGGFDKDKSYYIDPKSKPGESIACAPARCQRLRLCPRYEASPKLAEALVSGGNCEAGNKVPDVLGKRGAFDIAAGLNFEGYILGNVLRPMVKRVEGDDAYRVAELARSVMMVSRSARSISVSR